MFTTWNEEASTAYDELSFDDRRSRIFFEVSKVVDALEARPRDYRTLGRQLRVGGGMVWACTLHGDNEEWLITWSKSDQGIHIESLDRVPTH